MSDDFYNILGVERSADEATIKKAYRKQAMKFHPDKNPGDKEAEEKFKKAAQAYEVLGNPTKRQNYDRFGHAGGAGFGGQGFGDVGDIFDAFGDIFGDMFGGGPTGRRRRQGRGPRPGADLRYYLEVDLETVLSGDKQPIEFDYEVDCGTCNGSGAKEGTTPETCGHCGGAGQVVQRQGFFQMATTCPVCRGEGTIIKDPCDTCHGKGRTKSHKKLEVTVPAGIESGNQLRLSGEGEGGYLGGPAGHLYVEVRVRPDDRFERQGQNLISRINVSYLQALLGADLQVDGIEGKEDLSLPKGTEPGDLVKLSEKGLPSLRRAKRGEHIFQVHVEFPKKLAKKEEALLREIAQLKGEEVAEKKGFFS
ncbi:MAG: molecular chaperone DnaJ [Bdellovibrionaceae bacterium]|nr:molecular chaperone DnaJ [Pseudobdellovibrionaceae bacterium]|tara:strand:+ start:20381 stop:21472 length:1092 start_codon:yes stop_codon:yes gene_type:complete